MGLQKTVNNSPAIGLSGQPVVLGQSVYTTMNFYAKGVVLNIAIRGDYYLVAPAGTTPTKGYKVITTDATGAISFAASASTGETDTGWVVTEGGSAGDTIVISNHG